MNVEVYGASYATSRALADGIGGPMSGPATLRGVAGARISRWASTVPTTGLAGRLPVVLELGGNGPPTAAEVSDVDARFRRAGADAVWVVFRSWPDPGLRDKRDAARLAVKRGARHVLEVDGPELGELTADRAHLSADGYRRLGERIAAGLIGRGAATSRGLGPVVAGLALLVAAGVAWRYFA